MINTIVSTCTIIGLVVIKTIRLLALAVTHSITIGLFSTHTNVLKAEKVNASETNTSNAFWYARKVIVSSKLLSSSSVPG